MAIFGSRASFKLERLKTGHKCNNLCGRWLNAGDEHLVRYYRNDVGMPCRTVICSEECRLDYEDRHWQAKADAREEKTGGRIPC